MYISEQHKKGWLFIDIHESFFSRVASKIRFC